MWGVCLDIALRSGKMFQSVIEYEISADDSIANIIYPVKGVPISVANIRALDNPPQFVDGESVSPANHPELVGVIRGIGWHFDNQDYMYFITVNGRKKSKRYYANDLLKQ